MQKIKLAGSVILYNPCDDDISNIYSYLDDVDILYVMDNSERDNSKRIPKSKKIVYVYNNENQGISRPHNYVSEEVRKLGYKWLLTMDQDTYINENVIDEMKKVILKNDMSDIGIITPWHCTKLREDKPKENITYPLDTMTSGNIINLDIHEEIGGFKDWLFIDGVDIEYCLNLGVHNYKIMQLNYIEIEHNLGDIFYRRFINKDILITNHSAMRRYYQTRNYLYIRDMYVEYPKFKIFCEILVKKKQLIFGILFYENKSFIEKVRELRAIIKGIKDYKLKIKGKVDKYY